jgi:hypothetical protein
MLSHIVDFTPPKRVFRDEPDLRDVLMAVFYPEVAEFSEIYGSIEPYF